ncbi:MAG TPA: hypothetical protein VFH55_03845 [Nitrospiria bacterium]|nr:hypothetical protein [Nitrospiria bacterium]
MNKIFLWTLLFLLPAAAFAAEPASPKAMIETFFGEVQKGNIAGAYDQLFTGSPIPTDKPQAVTVLKQQTQANLPLYGKILGIEVVHEEKISDSVMRFVYILKTEKAPLTWEFYFYKPKAEWYLANINFNDQFNFLGGKK